MQHGHCDMSPKSMHTCAHTHKCHSLAMLQLGMYMHIPVYMQHGHCDMSPKSMHTCTHTYKYVTAWQCYSWVCTCSMGTATCHLKACTHTHKCHSLAMLQLSMYMHIQCTCSVGTATCHLKACTHTHKCYSWVCTCTSSCACSVGTATCQLNMDRPLTTGCNDLRLKNSQINDIVNHSSHHGRLGTPITFKVNTAQSVVVRLPDR